MAGEFDAGSAVGSLKLNIGGFTGGMLEAEGISELFPQVVSDFLANPLLGFAEIAKEVGETVVDTFRDVETEAFQTSIAAEKIGVSTKFLSEWGAVARAVGVDNMQLANGMFMLTRIVGEELVNPTKELTDAFNLLGINQSWLAQNSADSEAIFLRVREGLDGMTDASKRHFVMQELMSRGARDLVPLFGLQEDQIHKLMRAQEDFGDVTDDSEGRAGRAYEQLRVEAQEAIGGIEKAATMPILDAIVANVPQIESRLQQLATFGRTEIKELWTYIDGLDWKGMWKEAKDEFHGLVEEAPAFEAHLKSALGVAGELVKEIAAIAGFIDKSAHWVADKLTPGSGPNDPSWLGDPDNRRDAESIITRELGKTVSPAASDAQVQQMLDEAQAHVASRMAHLPPPAPNISGLGQRAAIDAMEHAEIARHPNDDAWAFSQKLLDARQSGHPLITPVINVHVNVTALRDLAKQIGSAVQAEVQKHLDKHAAARSVTSTGGQS